MSVNGRVISGKYRHRPLTVLFDSETRSTKERVKEGIFSALNDEVKNATILDLFAASGALGIEALSRGASSGIFCENNPKTAAILRKNMHFVEEIVQIIENDYEIALAQIDSESIDIVFLDPPYSTNITTVITAIMKANILRKKYTIVIETEHEFTDILKNAILKKYKYGRTHIAIIRGEHE